MGDWFVSLSLFSFVTIPTLYFIKGNSAQCSPNNEIEQSCYTKLIGNTPLVKLQILSSLLKRNVYVKMECLNPGGTGKDRAVKFMLDNIKSHHNYRDGVLIVEGSSGSTGISLASQCRSLDLNLHIVMPDDQAIEKKNLLETLGATVTVVPCCGISNENHYVNTARSIATQNRGIFINQFENLDNFQAHLMTTGPEIWSQTNGKVDAFIMSAGTGGTIAGVSK